MVRSLGYAAAAGPCSPGTALCHGCVSADAASRSIPRGRGSATSPMRTASAPTALAPLPPLRIRLPLFQ